MAKVSRTRPEMKMDDRTLMEFAATLYREQSAQSRPWNGRQITNAFQTALALATFKSPSQGGSRLTTAHFRQVSEASEQFEQYLTAIHGDHFTSERRPFLAHAHSDDARPRRSRTAISRNRSGPDNHFDSLWGIYTSSESSIESPGIARNHTVPQDSEPSQVPATVAPLQPPLQPYGNHQRYSHNPAFPMYYFPQQTMPHLHAWPPEMQQPVVVPAGMLHAIQTPQTGYMTTPMAPLQHQQNQFPIPSSTSPLPTFNTSRSDLGQTQTGPWPSPMPRGTMHPAQLFQSNISTPVTTAHSSLRDQVSDLQNVVLPQTQDAQLRTSHPRDVTRSGHGRKQRGRESMRSGSHKSQGGRPARGRPWEHSANDAQGFWSQLERDT